VSIKTTTNLNDQKNFSKEILELPTILVDKDYDAISTLKDFSKGDFLEKKILEIIVKEKNKS